MSESRRELLLPVECIGDTWNLLVYRPLELSGPTTSSHTGISEVSMAGLGESAGRRREPMNTLSCLSISPLTLTAVTSLTQNGAVDGGLLHLVSARFLLLDV